jgi:hypothetical protein
MGDLRHRRERCQIIIQRLHPIDPITDQLPVITEKLAMNELSIRPKIFSVRYGLHQKVKTLVCRLKIIVFEISIPVIPTAGMPSITHQPVEYISDSGNHQVTLNFSQKDNILFAMLEIAGIINGIGHSGFVNHIRMPEEVRRRYYRFQITFQLAEIAATSLGYVYIRQLIEILGYFSDCCPENSHVTSTL